MSYPNPNHQSKPLSSYINTKILRKSTLSPITDFSSNLPTNTHQNPYQIFLYLKSEIIILYYLHTYHTKHFLPVIIRLNQRKQYQISIKTTSMIKVSSKNKSV